MKETYLAVAGRISSEVRELNRVVKRTQSIWQEATGDEEDYHVDAAALTLHSFYAGLERVFEVIADGVDRTKPTGANWHQELLHQMASEIPAVRPAVLTSETRDMLDRFRGFRHVVRNIYSFRLDPGQIEVLIGQLPRTWDRTSQELLSFADLLEQLAR
jgi:hypothetical protein